MALMGRLWDGPDPGRKGIGRNPASRSEAITSRYFWQDGQKYVERWPCASLRIGVRHLRQG
jgi:hypothetical protein